VLSDRSLTQAECARALGVQPGTISRQLREMWDANLLKIDTESPQRGSRYWLREDVKDLLEEEVHVQTGRLEEDQTFVLVRISKLIDLARALQASDLTQSIAWVAEQTGEHRFLLAFESGVSTVHRNRLEAAIEAGGGSCSASTTTRVMSGSDWRRALAASRDAALTAGA
jgi:transcriptional regulator with XRE-family HTH domain